MTACGSLEQKGRERTLDEKDFALLDKLFGEAATDIAKELARIATPAAGNHRPGAEAELFHWRYFSNTRRK